MSKDKDLVVGAAKIATDIFEDELSEDQVYRLPQDGWPIFKVRGKLAARRSAMLAEMARREAAASKRAGTKAA